MNFRTQGSWIISSAILAGLFMGSAHAEDIAPSHSSRFIASGNALALSGQPELRNLSSQQKLSFMAKRDDMKFTEKLWTLLIESKPQFAFYSERVTLQLQSKWSNRHTQHYRYQILLDQVKVNGASITAHFSDHRLRAVSIAAPEFRKVLNYPHQVVALNLAQEADGKQALYVSIQDELRVALKFVEPDQNNLFTEVWEDALTGRVIERKIAGFDLISARVQKENARESETELVELPNLTSEQFLEGQYFTINTEHEIGRVETYTDSFDFQPYDRARFDQVAAYYNLSLGMNWYIDQFNYTFDDGAPLAVIVDSSLDGNPNNARYVPRGELSDTAMLVFGSGTYGKFEHLGRDRDVAMHELSHHIIYRYIDDARGDAGSLHEGFADYFTYAMTGDPYLAEQVIPDAPYLRSALLAEDKTYDNPYVQRNAHNLGQIWSAFLWDTREKIGPEFDQTVYQSLHYLNAGSSFGDAIEALLLADIDNNPSFAASSTEADPQVTGPHKCQILGAAVTRGYANYLTHLDGKSCGIDIQAVAAASQREAEPKYDDGPLLFQACGQLGLGNSLFSLFILLSTLAFPLILPVFCRNQGRR